MHQNPPTSHNNVAEKSQQFGLPLKNKSQIPLQMAAGAGQREVS